ncbi:type IX secretion system sortase PorU [Lacinutrix sp. MedPE-SW]|uniref:type IX secretion system sortase PorU n=1 Tax=Lacinutrix sp. MedPE-SW TaxID=1860087 RepID=UPI000915886E|nr:type IX secretion system sortase PorU [Lacinutrix sp. MedPE-SW]OIQ18836.1 MAG: peptidase C25 [Lacinutrix sp. MedPE-SW]
MKKILFLITLLSCVFSFAQQKKFSLNWEGVKTYQAGTNTIQVPEFSPKKNFKFSLAQGIQFVSQWKTNAFINENSVQVSNVEYTNISKSQLRGVDLSRIPSKINVSLKNVSDRDVNFAVLQVSAIVKFGNTYKKVNGFTINYTNSNRKTIYNRNPPITNSVLNTGSWYRFAVKETGVFKLSKSFLNQLGINIESVDPRTIKIYGTGGQMLPYRNSDNYPFDPAENAIQVIGEEDGFFHDSDYILFYGVGPTGRVNEPKINTNLNPYIDTAFYYISVGNGLGKRILPFQEPTEAATLTITNFQDYKFHEVDEFNLAFVGRRWFGDKFDIETSKTFDFTFPNLDTSIPINLKLIGVTTSTNAVSMDVALNGTQVSTLTIPAAAGANVASEAILDDEFSVTNQNISVQVNYDNQGVPSGSGYIDYLAIEATRDLNYNGNQFQFKNNETAQSSGVGQYVISGAANLPEVWDVTDNLNVTKKVNTNGDANFSFKSTLGTLKTFVAVSNSDFKTPIVPASTVVNNQNIKGTIFNNAQGVFQDIDYLIVTTNSHLNQAERLAQINRTQNNLNVKVLTLDAIYNEFSTGNKDIAAIRNAVKYIYDNASSPENRIKYLCLFGDSSFDYKSKIAPNTFNVPLWNAYSSFNYTNSYISDDFYGLMDDNEGDIDDTSSPYKLDIAVGRILANSSQRGKEMVDKVNTYYSQEAYGSWRNRLLFISDDVDEAFEKILQETTDEIADEISTEKPFFNTVKIHSDAFQQESSAGGDRYPEVRTAIIDAVEKGALVVNYFGHGGEDGFAFERVYEKSDAPELRNDCKLTTFVTITCDFTRFDNPLRETAGELTYWNKNAGAVALITTTREVFVSVGTTFNKKLEEYLFSYSDEDNFSDFEYPTMAEALRLTKNDNSINAQKELVFFIGDPAMKLAIPEPNVVLTKINDVPVQGNTEVLEALSYAKLAGQVTDVNGNLLSNYNGKLVTTIFDKPIQRETLANDGVVENGQLIKLQYETLGEVIFRGQATVTNGEFEFDFIVPRDIGIPVGYGKVSFYASTQTPLSDQTGATTTLLQIGGINENAAEDNQGPNIVLHMNDENFVSGGITNASPTLLVGLEDENGINTASGIGHDIVAILDGDEVNPFILNSYYVTELDDYTRGNLSFPFRDLEPGLHTLKLKAWDVYNNSSEAEIQFRVFDENEVLVIENVLNYPNPFVNYTEFWFSHNSSETLNVSVQIFTISGKLVRTLNGQTTGVGTKTTSSTSRDIVWDGRDDFGDKIGKGTYVYKLKVHSPSTNKSVEKIEKLVIL